MDLTKAQRLLMKIQAFLDNGNGNEISRLEKDLLKSYIIQLYDTVSTEEAPQQVEKPKASEIHVAKFQKTQVPDPVIVPEMPKSEPEKVIVAEVLPPKPKEVPLEIKIPVTEPVYVAPKHEEKPIHIPVTETVKVEIEKPISIPVSSVPPPVPPVPPESSDALAKLFEAATAEEVSVRFSHIPIDNIEAALGLNERIFTLNELFGGNRDLFETTCAQLNNLNSFEEATNVLLNGPAKKFKWADQERIKMAEHFIRIVSRRYPKA
jgi:hypothetical protein